jgi:hypothetical protein
MGVERGAADGVVVAVVVAVAVAVRGVGISTVMRLTFRSFYRNECRTCYATVLWKPVSGMRWTLPVSYP